MESYRVTISVSAVNTPYEKLTSSKTIEASSPMDVYQPLYDLLHTADDAAE